MNPVDALKYVAKEGGASLSSMASSCGLAENYLHGKAGSHRRMSAGRLAALAAVAGWELVLKKGTVCVSIDPDDIGQTKIAPEEEPGTGADDLVGVTEEIPSDPPQRKDGTGPIRAEELFSGLLQN